ncbi:hypothetical protein Trydic_g18877 [Trypoxylus dichotomus]
MGVTEEAKELKIPRESNLPLVMLYLHLHVLALIVPFIATNVSLYTYIFAIFLTCISVLGATAGAHRLWAHRSYAANVKLRIFLMICFCVSGYGTIYNWVLEHRFHHKYFGTKVDPFNHSKSIWNLQTFARVTRPKDGFDKLKETIDMSDIEKDGVVMFQKKYFLILYILFTLILPINAPAEYWGENWTASFLIIGVARYAVTVHLVALIETSSKIWGCNYNIDHDNDKKLVDTIERMDWITYHYIAPWDYQTNEFGYYGNDMISVVIRLFESMKLANNLKTMDGHIIGQAIQMSMDTNKPVADCLSESQFIDAKHSKFKQSHTFSS